MTLYSWVRELVTKYSFVKRTEFKNAQFYIYYDKDGKETVKRLPYRTNKTQLVEAMEAIKKDLNYYEERRKLMKQIKKTPVAGFAFTNKGEKK